jgi:hypothetical protein
MTPRGLGVGAECTDLRREQVDNGDTGLILQGMKAGKHPKWKKSQDQYSVVAQYMRAVTDIKGGPLEVEEMVAHL